MENSLYHAITKPVTRRRLMLALASLLALLPFAALKRMVDQRKKALKGEQKTIEVTMDLPQGPSILDAVIVTRTGDTYRAFSSKCPHLGCRIDTYKDGLLMCPCHGSSFDQAGTLKSGPATRGLDEMNITIDTKKKVLLIEPS